jgi:hypothetical protein
MGQTIIETNEYFRLAVSLLVEGRFDDADRVVDVAFNSVGGKETCRFLLIRLMLRLAQAKFSEARNITSFLAYTYKETTLAEGGEDLRNKLECWPYLSLLLTDYLRALERFPPFDDAWRRVTDHVRGKQ